MAPRTGAAASSRPNWATLLRVNLGEKNRGTGTVPRALVGALMEVPSVVAVDRVWSMDLVNTRAGRLAVHAEWLAAQFRQHRGNCDVIRKELLREHGVTVSLRTGERAVVHLRREVLAQGMTTVRYETPPGQQLQIDFGTVRVPVDGEPMKIYLIVATLGYSRRTFVMMFLHERQAAWLEGLEGASRHFGGTTREVLVDNAQALAREHHAQSRDVRFNERFHASAATGR